jgi:hypothetical protein
MSDQVPDVVASCLRIVVSDEAWEDIGFGKRPRYGILFRMFRPKWKVKLERTVLKEMLASVTAAHLIAGSIRPDDIPRIIVAYIAAPEVLAGLGYSSPSESADYLWDRIGQYRRTPIRDWAGLLVKHVAPTSIPDRQLSAALLGGCVKFSQKLNTMVVLRLTGIPSNSSS